MSAFIGALTIVETIANLPLAFIILTIAAIIGLTSVYALEMVSCWGCYDFPAIVMHEVGHVLSLDHPEEGGSHGGLVISLLNATLHDPETSPPSAPPNKSPRPPPLPSAPPSPPPPLPPPSKVPPPSFTAHHND